MATTVQHNYAISLEAPIALSILPIGRDREAQSCGGRVPRHKGLVRM